MTPVEIARGSRQSGLWLLSHPLTLNLLSFFALSLISFRHNAVYLFYGLDGRFEVSLISLSSLFTPAWPGFTSDFIHGIGNVSFTVNPWFVLGYFLSFSGYGNFNNFPLAYAFCAGELFLATFIGARLVGVPRWESLLGAWLMPLLTFQYAGWNMIPSTFRAFPHYATIAGVTMLIATMLLLIGRLPPLKAALAGAFAFLGISYIVIVGPTLLILGAPLFAIATLVSLAAARSDQYLRTRIAIASAIPALCVACGFATFLVGLTNNTAANFFPNLSIRPSGLQEVSLLFWSPIHPFMTIERGFVLAGLLGGVLSSLYGRGTLQLAAASFVATASLYLLIGSLHAYHPFWFGPAFWYFEDFLLPFHGIFAIVLLSNAVRGATRLLLRPSRLFLRVGRAPATTALISIAIAAIPWFYIWEQQKRVASAILPYYEAYPQRETAITRILKNEIALSPGAPFRGREATLTGRIFPLSTNVDIVGLSGMPDVLAMQTTGNLHSFAGLWQDNIPTFLEYNPLMTPAYFVFSRRFFTEPADRQIRNVLAMRRIDPRMLAAVGVRFFVTDAPFGGDARLRETISVPVTPEMLSRLGIRDPIPSFALYLYELDHVNLGQYSPTEIRHVETASELLDFLGDPSVDLSRTAVTSAEISSELAPATLLSFVVDRGFFRLRAVSNGWSLLVLPMEYSRCFHLDEISVAAGVRLFRTNLIMTGVLFKNVLDTRLTYHTGPFAGSRCRILDAGEMTAMKIEDAFRHKPELAPATVLR